MVPFAEPQGTAPHSATLPWLLLQKLTKRTHPSGGTIASTRPWCTCAIVEKIEVDDWTTHVDGASGTYIVRETG